MKYLIKASWVVLIACMLVKLFGGNYFEIATNNENFINICNYVDNNFYLKMILACVIYLISGYFIFCIIFKSKYLKLKYILIFTPLMICKSILGWYYEIIAFVLDIFILLIIPTIINKNIKRNIICFLLIALFQIISLITRDLSLYNFNDNNTLVSLIMQVDYYIMIFIYYLYTIKRRVA